MNQTLKGIICLTLITLTILLSAGNQVQAATTANYTVNQYQIKAVLLADGSAVITETISYQLNRRVKQFEYTIDYTGAGSIKLDKIGVSSQTSDAAAPVYVEVLPAKAASNQLQPMTYEVKDDGSELQIQLNVLSEAASLRTISISYQLSQAVVRHSDGALFKRRFFTSGDMAAFAQPSLTVQLPQAATALQFWSLPVSLTDFSMSQPQNDQLVYQAGELPAGQDLTLFCLLPLDFFPKAATAAKSQTWEALAASAHQMDDEISQHDRLISALTVFLYVLLAMAIVIVLLIYWIFDRERAAQFRQRYLLEMPPDCLPAIAAILLHRARPGRLILGTLLDLVRRGELSLHGCVFTLLKPDRTDYPGFTAYEIFLLQWLFGHMTTGTTLSTAEIRRFAREPATAQKFQVYYQQFRQLLDEEIVSRGLIDTDRTRKGRISSWLAAAVYLVLAGAASIGLRSAVGLHLLIPTVILTIYSLQIRRLTDNGSEMYAQCQALLRTIRQFRHQEIPADSVFTQSILPLAVSTGLAGRWLEQLLADRPDQWQPPDGLFQEYGIVSTSKAWPEHVRSLANDLKVMESMLSASLLMASGIHW